MVVGVDSRDNGKGDVGMRFVVGSAGDTMVRVIRKCQVGLGFVGLNMGDSSIHQGGENGW